MFDDWLDALADEKIQCLIVRPFCGPDFMLLNNISDLGIDVDEQCSDLFQQVLDVLGFSTDFFNLVQKASYFAE